MRIVLDLQACQTSGSRNRGIGRYSMSLALAMARHAQGHEVLLALNSRFPDTIDPIRQAFDGLVMPENIRVFDVPGPLQEYDPASAWRCQAAERIREIFLAGLSPDIVHVSSLFEGWGDDAVTPIGHFNNRFETAVTLYDLIPYLYKETYLAEPVSRALYFRKLQALKNAELLLAISDHSRREAIGALQLADKQVVNISSAADDMFVPRTLSIEESLAVRNRLHLTKPFVMYTGGIDWRKNIEGLIEAFALLPEAIRMQYQLAVVCKMQEADQQRLQALAVRHGLTRNEVVFTGFVSDEDLVSLYNLATLFVFPSLHEGFGLPVLEAMSCGAPVIGSKTSSIPEVIGREDVLFDPADSQAIAAKMQMVLTNEGFRTELRDYGFKQAKQFSWDKSGKCALDAFECLHEAKQERRRTAVPVKHPRPRLAYISPLPPEKSGIADYSAELLPELARHYQIEIISAQAAVQDTWINANFQIRTVEWFEAHADEYDRVVYHFGNSAPHEHMFGLLDRHPGIVVLHDFFLSGVHDYIDRPEHLPGTFARTLYESHGYHAVQDEQLVGRVETMRKYPCNKQVLEQATGIIVHSRYSMQLADAWYGHGSAKDWRHVPLLKAIPAVVDRTAARKRLGLSDGDFLVCSFGLLAPTKLNHRLLEAWLASPLASDERCHLIFVGELDKTKYGEALSIAIAGSTCRDRIKITGFAPQETYRDYLESADIAVQLRSHSRGETSASILDCLAYGAPTIINANGAAGELSEEALIKLPDEFTDTELSSALKLVWEDRELSAALSRRAVDYARSHHHPALVGEMYRDAIEHFALDSDGANFQRLIQSLKSINTLVPPTEQDLLLAASSIASNQPGKLPRQILVDVSDLVNPTGTETMSYLFARNALAAMLATPPAGYRVEPVHGVGRHFQYARGFTTNLLDLAGLNSQDTAVEVKAGDRFIGLRVPTADNIENADSDAEGIPAGMLRDQEFFASFELLRHEILLKGAHPALVDWLCGSVDTTDALACISVGLPSGANGMAKANPPAAFRHAARKRLRLKDADILVCLLAAPGATGFDDRLLDVWLKSPLAGDERYHLVFLGENHDNGVGENAMAGRIAQSAYADRIRCTGFIPKDLEQAYLAAADVAVQLQSHAVEDASESLRNCLAFGIPTVVNSVAAQALGRALLHLQEGFDQAATYEAAETTAHANPSRVLDIYRDSIARFASGASGATGADMPEIQDAAITIAPAASVESPRQMLVDISFLVEHNLKSGIQRVVRNVLAKLLSAPPSGYSVEPVYDAGGYYAYARKFTARFTGSPEQNLEDMPIQVKAGDMFLGLDLFPPGLIRSRSFFTDLRAHDVQLMFVVFDLLPVLRPDLFPEDAQANFVGWLETVARISDGLVCISRTVADELLEWVDSTQPPRDTPLQVGYFHLGADIGTAQAQANLPDAPHRRPSILMVGTIEPRKGYAQALSAFEKLWAQGTDADLVIVGRQGWMVDELATRMRTHPEYGKHLFWFEGADDDTLRKLYGASSALLLASEGEGFGLPLIEAAQHKLPLITRDLPVFREVAGDNAYYFSGTSTDALADAMQEWLDLYAAGCAPSSEGVRWITWTESAQQLLNAVLKQNWYRQAGVPDAPPVSAAKTLAADTGSMV